MLQWCCLVRVVNRNNGNMLLRVCKNLLVIAQKKSCSFTFSILNDEYSKNHMLTFKQKIDLAQTEVSDAISIVMMTST